MFGGCKTLFSRLGQKVNKNIDALWPQDDAASRQDIPIWLSILIKFEATEFWDSIFDSFSKFLGYSIDSNEIPDSSFPHFIFRQIGNNVHFSFRQTVQKLVYGEGS